MKKILNFKNLNEALRIKALLEAENIPFVIRDFTDSSYSSVFQDQYGWGTLEAPEEYAAKIVELINLNNTQLADEVSDNSLPMANSGKNFYQILILILFVACVVLGWLYYDLKRRFELSQIYSPVNSEWSGDGEAVIFRWKKNDHLAYMYSDENFNSNFEKGIGYDTSGNQIFINIDFNENGLNDKFTYYSGKDSIREDYIDLDEDGMPDITNVYLPDGYYLSFRTDMKNKKYTDVLLLDSKNNIIKKYSLTEFLNYMKN